MNLMRQNMPTQMINLKNLVMQCCYAFMNSTSFGSYFSSLERFSLIFSGLCHDVAHTGHNNMFEMNSLSKLALRYHDKSVIFYF